MGDFYIKGLCLDKSYEKALYWYSKAAAHKVSYTGYDLKTAISEFDDVPNSYEEILEEYNMGFITYDEVRFKALRFLQHWKETQDDK